jgi:hypothetical protein
MLTNNQLRILLTHNEPTNRLRRCLFGRPDRQETRKLLEEQFATDRQYMITNYKFDILTCRFVSNSCFHENGDTVTAFEDNVLVPESNEEVENRHCSPESGVRHRAGRYAPYNNRQTKITGKRIIGTVPMFPGLEMGVDVGRRRLTSPDL